MTAASSQSYSNGKLQVLALPLSVVASTIPSESIHSSVGLEHVSQRVTDSLSQLFLPGRLETLIPFEFDGGSVVYGAEPRDEIGLGSPSLICTRITGLGTTKLRFGCSDGTISDSGEDDYTDTWRLRPAVCTSLWWTHAGAVLTVERLGVRSELDGITNGGYFWTDRDVAKIWPILLARVRVDTDPNLLSLVDLFGPPIEAVVGTSRANEPVLALTQRAPERIGGTRVTEGAYFVVMSAATPDVDALRAPDHDPDRVDHAQTNGVFREWHPLQLGASPVEPGATSAIRDDSRVVLLNLESMSVRHDYAGVAGGVIASVIPTIAHRADVARDFDQLSEILKADPPDLESTNEKVGRLVALRRRRAERRLQSWALGAARFDNWSTSLQLASRMLTSVRLADAAFEDDIDELAVGLQGMVEGQRAVLEQQRAAAEQRRASQEEHFTRNLSVFATVAAVLAVLPLWGALATIPGWNGSGFLLGVQGALFCSAGFVLLGGVVSFLLIRRRGSA